MTKTALKAVISFIVGDPQKEKRIIDEVEAFVAASNKGNALVSGALPQSQSEINSFLLVNALRLLNDENRDGLCASLFARSSDKEQLLNRLIELGGNDR